MEREDLCEFMSCTFANAQSIAPRSAACRFELLELAA